MIILIRLRSSFISNVGPPAFSIAFLASNAVTADVLLLTTFLRPKRVSIILVVIMIWVGLEYYRQNTNDIDDIVY